MPEFFIAPEFWVFVAVLLFLGLLVYLRGKDGFPLILLQPGGVQRGFLLGLLRFQLEFGRLHLPLIHGLLQSLLKLLDHLLRLHQFRGRAFLGFREEPRPIPIARQSEYLFPDFFHVRTGQGLRDTRHGLSRHGKLLELGIRIGSAHPDVDVNRHILIK